AAGTPPETGPPSAAGTPRETGPPSAAGTPPETGPPPTPGPPSALGPPGVPPPPPGTCSSRSLMIITPLRARLLLSIHGDELTVRQRQPHPERRPLTGLGVQLHRPTVRRGDRGDDR